MHGSLGPWVGLGFRRLPNARSSAARRHFSGFRRAFSLQIRRLTVLAGQEPVGTRVARFRPTGLPISESPVGKRFSLGPGATPADSSPDHPDVPPASPAGARVDTRRTSCTMSESPVFTGDSGSPRAYVLRNSGTRLLCFPCKRSSPSRWSRGSDLTRRCGSRFHGATPRTVKDPDRVMAVGSERLDVVVVDPSTSAVLSRSGTTTRSRLRSYSAADITSAPRCSTPVGRW
jgi:hypothetical protein